MIDLVEPLKFPIEFIGSGGPSAKSLALRTLLAERILALSPPRRWIQSRFKAAGKVESKDLDDVFWQASCRVVGMVHLLVQIPLAIYILLDKTMQNDPIHATTDLSFIVTVISAGYFCYDLYVCIFRWEGAAYLLHGFTCCTLYTYCALTGFLHHYAAMFLLWELSTPFVYARWFLYQYNLAGSKVYIANGLAMLVAFFLARNVGGVFMLISFFKSSADELNAIGATSRVMTPYMIWVYRLACITLTGLNAIWFYKMLKGALKIFVASKPANRVEEEITES